MMKDKRANQIIEVYVIVEGIGLNSKQNQNNNEFKISYSKSAVLKFRI